MAAKAQTYEFVTKAVLCNVTGKPVAMADVAANVREIKVASCYSFDGDAVNVGVMKVSDSKKALAQLKNSGAFARYAQFDEQTGTFCLPNDSDL